jgi:hypothetical protein
MAATIVNSDTALIAAVAVASNPAHGTALTKRRFASFIPKIPATPCTSLPIGQIILPVRRPAPATIMRIVPRMFPATFLR